jgi:1,4-dihydroxy-2-naphthoate octaprenyltransferase
MTDNLRIRTPPENVEEIFIKKRNTIKEYRAILNLLVLFTCVNVYLLTMMVVYNQLSSFIFGIIGTPIFIGILYQAGQIYAALSTYGELSPQEVTVATQKKGCP